MSWGERSCKTPCRCPDKCDISTCNVDCPGYIWDGATKPDSVHSNKIDFKKAFADSFSTGKPLPLSKSARPKSNKRLGRNELCHCGSGIKFKKCCGGNG